MVGAVMKRKQIYLDIEQDKRLKRLAGKVGKSEAALVREALEVYMTREQSIAKPLGNDPLLELIGLCQNPEGPKDASFNHDLYLYGKEREPRWTWSL